MPGLLEALGSVLDGSGIAGQVTANAGQLSGVTSAVQSLTLGPAALTNLEGAIGALPRPPGLEGLASMSSRLGAVSIPSDLSGLLQPILGPLAALPGQLAGGAAANATTAFNLVREIMRIASGRNPGGPSGMPDDAFPMPDAPTPEELRGLFASANEVLDQFGPRLDAARLLDFIRQAGAGASRPLFWLPQIPLVDDVLQPLAVVAEWQTLNGPQLSAHLARTIELAAELIAMPRTRVARPIVDTGQIIATGSTTLAALNADLTPVLARLRTRIIAGNGRPSFTDLTTVERGAAILDQLAGALDPESSPLAHPESLDERLTRSLLVAVRTLQPPYDLAPLAVRLRELIGQIPSSPPDVFGSVITAINDFDLSVLTDPLRTVTETVRGVVDQVNAARDSVRQAIEEALAPVADALDSALQSVGFDQIRETLDGLPATVQGFMDTEITPNLAAVRDGVHDAVEAVSAAAESFNPEALIAPIRDAVEQAAALLRSDEIRETFEQLEQALTEAVQALGNIDLGGAADQSISLLGDIEVKLADIDTTSIPDAAKPLLRQGVEVVANIDFSVEAGDPLLRNLEGAVQQGPAALLATLEQGMDQLRAQIESFRPSAVIGAQLDQPFRELTQALANFRPSDLLERLQETLDGLASRLQVLDVGVVLDPLVELHTAISTQVEALRPSNLLRPVDDAIRVAIERVYEVTRIDTAFAGINEVLDTIQAWVGLLADARDILARGASLFEQPGDATASVQIFVDEALARLDAVDLARLQSAFTAASAAVASVDRNAITADLARALQTAGQSGPPLLVSGELQAIIAMVRTFPFAALRAHRETPDRNRLVTAFQRMHSAVDRLERARPGWVELSSDLIQTASSLQERLLDYFRVTQLESTGVFAEFSQPPTTTAALKESVRRALTDAVQEPIVTVLTAFQAIAPYLRLLAAGVSGVFGALHAKVDSLVGSGGIGGAVDAIEDAANLLRTINLQPLTGPLDAVYGRIETAVNAINPEPLRAALEAARDAIAGLIRINTLIDPADVAAMDQAYATAIARLGELAPSAVISATLDPVYEDLLADILPVLGLPLRLRILIEDAGRSLREECLRELARVEVAFDRMLRAIPLEAMGGGASVEGSVSVGVG